MKVRNVILMIFVIVLFSGCVIQDPDIEIDSESYLFNHFAGSMHLLKNKENGQHHIVVKDVKSYVVRENLVYIQGKYVKSKRENELEYYNSRTNSFEEWEDNERIPSYLVLDLDSGLIDSYVELEDVPSGQRLGFEKKLFSFLCEFSTGCFKKIE